MGRIGPGGPTEGLTALERSNDDLSRLHSNGRRCYVLGLRGDIRITTLLGRIPRLRRVASYNGLKT